MTSVSLQLPILFDVSAGAVAFGEDASGVDIFDAHLKFELASGSNLTAIRDAFQNIMYADASENDTSGVLFYTDITGLSDVNAVATNISKSIQSGILNGNLTQYNKTENSGLYQDVSAGTGEASWNRRYASPGIPLPVYSIKHGDTSNNVAYNTWTSDAKDNTLNLGGGDASKQGYFIAPICDNGGTKFGRVLIRLMATHLMGHPFAQAFIANEESILKDISDCDIATQITDNLFTATKSLYPTNSGISGETIQGVSAGLPMLKHDGIKNTILQRIYEQLLGTAPERFDLSGSSTLDLSGVYNATGVSGTDFYFVDVSGISGGNLDPSYCIPRKLPIRTSDTMSFYFRPRVKITLDSSGSVLPLTSGGSANDVSNVNIVNAYAGATAQSAIQTIFFQPRHRWISHKYGTDLVDLSGNNRGHTIGSSDGLFQGTDQVGGEVGGPLMTGTNLVNNSTATNYVYFDAHIWRIKATF